MKTNLQGKSDAVSVDSLLDALFRVSVSVRNDYVQGGQLNMAVFFFCSCQYLDRRAVLFLLKVDSFRV